MNRSGESTVNELTQEQADKAQFMREQKEDVLLKVEGLRVWFELRRFGFGHAGYVRAVDNVNFDLKFGEAIAIVGESGCGKSSLMRSILGLHMPTEGEITFDGRQLTKLRGEDLRLYRSEIGYVQQDPYGALPPFMTVQRILEEPQVINGIKSKEERLAAHSQVAGRSEALPSG
jgi:peptide/nickel transport system ATP-binding protein